MTIPAKLPLRGRRNAYFGGELQFKADDPDTGIEGPVDLTGCTARMEMRLYGAQPGSAKVTLPSVTGNTQGVWVIEPAEGRIQYLAYKSTMRAAYDALRGDAEPGADIALEYDLIINDGSQDDVWAEGVVSINAGVTE